jgi:malonyl-CoA O-methyltransferase
VSALPVREAYRLWAPTYASETAVSFLENQLVEELGPPVEGRRLLDAGCGIARRLTATPAALAVGVDLTPEMLAHASGVPNVTAAAATDLPFADGEFDLVWCRLVLGHVSGIEEAYRELSRVCAPDASVIVTDFHSDAVAAGHRRTFRDALGDVREVEHHVYVADDHTEAAGAAGLALVDRREGVVGPDVRQFYATAGRLDAYQSHLGLPIVLALAFRKA